MGRYFCGIYNAPVKSNIDDLIETMAKLNAVLSVLDIKLYNRFNIKVKGNCGCDFGELFRINNSYIKPDNKAGKDQTTSLKKTIISLLPGMVRRLTWQCSILVMILK